MAFVSSPDGIPVELLQSGEALAPGRTVGEHGQYWRVVIFFHYQLWESI